METIGIIGGYIGLYRGYIDWQSGKQNGNY